MRLRMIRNLKIKEGHYFKNFNVPLHLIPAFLLGISQVTLMLSISIIIEQTALSAVWLSVLLGFVAIVYIIASPQWGKHTDIYGANNTLHQTSKLFMVSQFMFVGVIYFVPTIDMTYMTMCLLLLVARVMYTVSASGLFPAIQTYAIETRTEKERIVALSDISGTLSLGRFLAPFLFTLTVDIHPLAPLISVAVLSLIPVLAFKKVQTVRSVYIKKDTEHRTAKHLYICFLLALMLSMLLGQFQFSLGPFIEIIEQDTTISASKKLSYIFMFIAIVMIFTQFVFIRKFSKHTGLLLFSSVTSLIVGTFLINTSTTMLSIVLACGFVAFAISIMIPMYTTYSSKSVPKQGVLAGKLGSYRMIGYAFGAGSGGLMLEYSKNFPFLNTYVISTFIIVGIVYIYRDARKKTDF